MPQRKQVPASGFSAGLGADLENVWWLEAVKKELDIQKYE